MRIRKVDDNQKKLVKQIRKCGISVLHLHTVGKGCPDLLLGAGKINKLVEVKDPKKPPSQRKLTEDEKCFHESWNGQVDVVENIDDVLKLFQ